VGETANTPSTQPKDDEELSGEGDELAGSDEELSGEGDELAGSDEELSGDDEELAGEEDSSRMMRRRTSQVEERSGCEMARSAMPDSGLR